MHAILQEFPNVLGHMDNNLTCHLRPSCQGARKHIAGFLDSVICLLPPLAEQLTGLVYVVIDDRDRFIERQHEQLI